jgi:hypothetical protein
MLYDDIDVIIDRYTEHLKRSDCLKELKRLHQLYVCIEKGITHFSSPSVKEWRWSWSLLNRFIPHFGSFCVRFHDKDILKINTEIHEISGLRLFIK